MKHITAIIFGLAIVIAAYFLGNAYVKRAHPAQVISVTGLGNENFTSDLIVWEGRFSSYSPVRSKNRIRLKRNNRIAQQRRTI